MRFKTIFIIFNIVIVFSFLFIFFMPLILLGGEHFSGFFRQNWFIVALFIATLAVFNTYFLRNWGLFHLLEREDWAALIDYLEDRIYQKGQLRKSSVKILLNAYLVTSRTSEIGRLRSYVSERKPSLVGEFAIQFGIPYLIENRPEESERYFGKLLAESRIKERNWVRWNHAFSLMQLKQFDAAKQEFLTLIDTTRNPLVQLLSIYMMNSFPNVQGEEKTLVEEKIAALKGRYSQQEMSDRVEKAKGNVQVLIFSKVIKDAMDWIYRHNPTSKNVTIH